MISEDLRDLAIKTLDSMKGIEITTMDVRSLTSITDYMIICTGRSTRQLKALADAVVLKAKEAQVSVIRKEGGNESEWVLVDLGDVVVHIMTQTSRSFYNLEDLWEPIKELRQQNNSI